MFSQHGVYEGIPAVPELGGHRDAAGYWHAHLQSRIDYQVPVPVARALIRGGGLDLTDGHLTLASRARRATLFGPYENNGLLTLLESADLASCGSPDTAPETSDTITRPDLALEEVAATVLGEVAACVEISFPSVVETARARLRSSPPLTAVVSVTYELPNAS
jgi:hypothetical protein